MKRRSQPKIKSIKHPSYSDKVKGGNMMYGPNPHHRGRLSTSNKPATA